MAAQLPMSQSTLLALSIEGRDNSKRKKSFYVNVYFYPYNGYNTVVRIRRYYSLSHLGCMRNFIFGTDLLRYREDSIVVTHTAVVPASGHHNRLYDIEHSHGLRTGLAS